MSIEFPTCMFLFGVELVMCGEVNTENDDVLGSVDGRLYRHLYLSVAHIIENVNDANKLQKH